MRHGKMRKVLECARPPSVVGERVADDPGDKPAPRSRRRRRGDNEVGPDATADAPIDPTQATADAPIDPTQATADAPIDPDQTSDDARIDPTQATADAAIDPDQTS